MPGSGLTPPARRLRPRRRKFEPIQLGIDGGGTTEPRMSISVATLSDTMIISHARSFSVGSSPAARYRSTPLPDSRSSSRIVTRRSGSIAPSSTRRSNTTKMPAFNELCAGITTSALIATVSSVRGGGRRRPRYRPGPRPLSHLGFERHGARVCNAVTLEGTLIAESLRIGARIDGVALTVTTIFARRAR